MSQYSVTSEQALQLIHGVSVDVKNIMSKEPFDTSHDYHHIERVLELAQKLATDERRLHPEIELDPTLITLTTILHDIGDSKYVLPSTSLNAIGNPALTPQDILLSHSAPPALASMVQLLTANVSCSNEQKHPRQVTTLCARHPELAIVQDADRLDALGAIGVARVFVFNSARGQSLARARTVLETHLLPREAMMKTASGKSMAKERCDFLRFFIAQWDQETNCQHEDEL